MKRPCLQVRIQEPTDQTIWFLMPLVEDEDENQQVERAYEQYRAQREKWNKPVFDMYDLAMEFGIRA
jgi:hypothetical protein